MEIPVQEKEMSLSGSKAHPLWYVDLGREAKKEIVVERGLLKTGRR
jgi:hypothetical protein